MCTYNGAKYLKEQLDSFEAQTHRNWRLVVSDDGSIDDTLAILQACKTRWGADKVEIRKGPQKGFCQNFLSLATDSEIKSDYYAFSDQDDVWLPGKLAVAITKLQGNDSVVSLYCGRTSYVKDDLQPYAKSPLFALPKTFGNALVQSIAGGNTMVFNQCTKSLLEKAGAQATVSHDWWLYQLVSGAGGLIHYDPEPQILYRQHPQALVGGNNSLLNKFERLGMLLQGRFKDWTDLNIRALKAAQTCLTPDAFQVLLRFERLRGASVHARLKMLKACSLYRQTWQGSMGLKLAALLNKI